MDVAAKNTLFESRCGNMPICRQISRQADAGTRTPDPLLTMEVLYRLSYVGVGTSLIGWSGGSRIRTCVGRANGFTARLL